MNKNSKQFGLFVFLELNLCIFTQLVKKHHTWDDWWLTVITFEDLGPPQNAGKIAPAGLQMDFGQGTQGTENGTVGQFYFSI